MKKGLCRLGDYSLGHEDWPPRRVITASSTVFINGLGAVRQGDLWEVHCDDDSHCHDGYSIANSISPRVFIEGLAIVVEGDLISCGDTVGPGSLNVFFGV